MVMSNTMDLDISIITQLRNDLINLFNLMSIYKFPMFYLVLTSLKDQSIFQLSNIKCLKIKQYLA